MNCFVLSRSLAMQHMEPQLVFCSKYTWRGWHLSTIPDYYTQAWHLIRTHTHTHKCS